jgi:hypothetical protein
MNRACATVGRAGDLNRWQWEAQADGRALAELSIDVFITRLGR